MTNQLIFIKLGGSLITDKDTPRSPRQGIIEGLAQEIYSIRQETSGLKIILGHGSGSYGHVPAKKYQTRQGVKTTGEWMGFAEVWWEAARLNHILLKAMHDANLPAISFPVSSSALSQDGKVISWNLELLRTALNNNLLPVVYGDVVFDSIRGGTILSTEDIFTYLTRSLHPDRIFITGIEAGVWSDHPRCTQIIPKITPDNYDQVLRYLGGSDTTDVTGGMTTKVEAMLELVTKLPNLEVRIFSGVPIGNISNAIKGKPLGTKIVAQ